MTRAERVAERIKQDVSIIIRERVAVGYHAPSEFLASQGFDDLAEMRVAKRLAACKDHEEFAPVEVALEAGEKIDPFIETEFVLKGAAIAVGAAMKTCQVTAPGDLGEKIT